MSNTLMHSAIANIGFVEKVLWVRVGVRRQPTPNPSLEGKTGGMGNLEEAGE
ncbi:MAG: hypothetical protein F6K35_03110 [Okeania sp. SIO2H7]|nr:hypothetical protein [Okeania sp. SIO2H7]